MTCEIPVAVSMPRPLAVRVETCSGLPGDPGADGDDGERGSRWWAEDEATPTPESVPDPLPGDMFLFTSGEVRRFNGSSWVLAADLRGPAGAGNISTVNGDAGPDVVLTPEDLGILPDRLYVSAADHGVVGDGVADDHAAMVTAIAAAVGTRLVLDSGPVVSLSAPLALPSNIHLDLNGRTLLRAYNGSPDADGTAVLRMRNVERVTISNGVIDGNGDNFPNGTSGYNLTAGFGVDSLTYRDVTFRHVIDNHAIDLTDATNVRILDCNFLGFRNNPGQRDFSEAIQIDPNGVSGTGATNRDWLVSGNTFGPSDVDPVGWGHWPAGIGNHADLAETVSERFRIVNNHFEGCSFSAVRIHCFKDVAVSNNVFVDCRYGVWANPASSSADPSLDIARNYGIVISDNVCTGGNKLAILDWTDNFTVSGNVIREPSEYGLHLRFCRAGAVTGNQIYRSTGHGIMVNESGFSAYARAGHTCDITLTGNQIKYAGSSGMRIEGLRRPIIGNNLLIAGSYNNNNASCIALIDVSGALVIGNYNSQSTSPNQDTYGLRGTGTTSNVTSVGNKLSGSVADEDIP